MTRSISMILVIILIAAGFVGLNSMFRVSEIEQAVVLRLGEPVRVINQQGHSNPGLHFKLPFIENVLFFDKRNLDFELASEEIQSDDQERLVVDAFLRYRIVDPLIFYQRLRNEDGARGRLGPILESSLRGVIGSIPSRDVISGQRAALMVRIRQAVDTQVNEQGLGIEVIDVRIRRADLPQQIASRVFQRMSSERRQRAEQIRAEGEQRAREIRADADRQATVIRAEARAEAERIRGEGDGRRNAIYAAAYGRDAEFFSFYRSMTAYEEALRAGTPIVIPPDSEFFRYFRSERGAGGPGR
ncbi:MAG: protease modulator HflC [Maricaulaceae bacterium]|nr:protease modulator HflC [Maricaulaceae bacterium]